MSKRTVKLKQANLLPNAAPDTLNHIRLFSRVEANKNQGAWEAITEKEIINFVVQFPIKDSKYVTHVDVSQDGYVKVSLRKRDYEGTWITIGEVDTKEVLTLRKLSGESKPDE